MNTSEAAALLGVTPGTAQQWARKKLVPCRVIEHRRRSTYIWNKDVILEFVRGDAPVEKPEVFTINVEALERM